MRPALLLATLALLAAPPTAAAQMPRTDLYGDPLPPGALARFGTVRWRPGERCLALAFTPDGKTLLSAGPSGVSAWEVSTGKRRRRFGQHDGPIEFATFSPDRKLVATIDSGTYLQPRPALLRVWDVASGTLAWEACAVGANPAEAGKQPAKIAAAFAPDGGLLAVSVGLLEVELWDVKTGKPRARLVAPRAVPELGMVAQTEDMPRLVVVHHCLVFSPDGKRLLAANSNGACRVWDVATGAVLPPGQPGQPEIEMVLAAAAADRLVWSTPDGVFAGTWKGERRQLLTDLEDHRPFALLAVSPDGRQLVLGSGGSLEHWDLGTTAVPAKLPGLEYAFLPDCASFSADGKTVAAALGPALCLWDVSSGRLLTPEHGPLDAHRVVTLSPDGKMVVASGTGQIWYWDAATAKVIRKHVAAGDLGWPMLSPDGRVFLTQGDHFGICVRDPATGKELRPIAVEPPPVAVLVDVLARCAAGQPHAPLHAAQALFDRDQDFPLDQPYHVVGLMPDGKTLVVRQRKWVSHWDVATGRKLRAWPLSYKESRCVDLASGSRALLQTPDDQGSRVTAIRDLATGQDLARVGIVEVPWDKAFSPNGKSLLLTFVRPHSVFSKPLRFQVIETHTGLLRRELVFPAGDVRDWQVAPDNRLLAVAFEDGNVRFWDLATGESLGEFRIDAGVYSLAFSDDGRRLLTVCDDTSILLWDVAAVAKPARNLAPDGLTAANLAALWSDLASSDAGLAYRALWKLAAAPRQTVPYLAAKLRPLQVDPAQVQKWIDELDSDSYPVRARATAALADLSDLAVPYLEKALMPGLRLEKRRRLELLLEKAAALPVSPRQLRELRAVEVLELIGTAEARKVLAAIADGDPQTRQTRDAQLALLRPPR